MKNDTEYQRQIAESLILSLGVDEAVYFALQNHWDGVLAHMPKGARRRPARPRVPHSGADYRAI